MPVKKTVSMHNVEILNSTARVIITLDNYKDLSEIVLLLKQEGIASICFSQVELSESLSENHNLLVPAKDMLPVLLKAIKTAQKEKLAYNIENLPLCLLPGQEDHFTLSKSPGVKMQFCTDCELSPRCGGITKAQLIAEYGTQLLSWQFLFPKNFFTEQDIAFLDEQLLKEANKV